MSKKMNNNTVALADTDYQRNNMQTQSDLDMTSAKRPSANKKLSDSKLRIAAIQALPTGVETTVTLKEAIRGTVRSFRVNDRTPCNTCTGLKPGNRLHCSECKGLGYKQIERTVEVQLPGSLLTGQEIRLDSLGGLDFRSGKNGDLIVRITISDHPYLKVDGKNICCILPVSLYEAVLGAEIEVPTATGKVVMKLQPLTQSGRIYRLKGLGLSGGDQLVTIEIIMPQMLTKEQVALFQKIKEKAGDSNPRGDLIFSH